ncbi:hypothetical protein ACLB2K_005315 [Fragaria x ananassa]
MKTYLYNPEELEAISGENRSNEPHAHSIKTIPFVLVTRCQLVAVHKLQQIHLEEPWFQQISKSSSSSLSDHSPSSSFPIGFMSDSSSFF